MSRTSRRENVRRIERCVQHLLWQRLYRILSDVLAAHGDENPYGDGDFWVVDDDWGCRQQKVLITRPDFLTVDLITAVQAQLRARFPRWSVIFVFPSDAVPPPDCMIVFPDRIEQREQDRD